MRQEAWKRWTRDEVPLRVGVSSCLLGLEVRHDRVGCREDFLTEELGPFVEWVPHCPELELGLGVPRPPLRLEESGSGEARLVVEGSGVDFTSAMVSRARTSIEEFGELDGFILKKASPSCGPRDVVLHRSTPDRELTMVAGVFASILQERMPFLPVEDEGRLSDPHLRARFVLRIFGHNRWRAFLAGPPSLSRLEEFHAAHRLLLLAHDESGLRRLGSLLENRSELPEDDVLRHYGHIYHEILRKAAAPRRHVKVMQLALTHLRGLLDGRDRRSLRLAIEDYGRGALALSAPISLLRFHAERCGVEALLSQVYLEPHPKELLSLRSA